VKTESRLVLTQEPSPMMTSFLGRMGQHSTTAQITEINLKDLGKEWIHWASLFGNFGSLYIPPQDLSAFLPGSSGLAIAAVDNNTAGKTMPAAAP